MIFAWVAIVSAVVGVSADDPSIRSAADHWSFRSPVGVAVPQIAGDSWRGNEIDSFIAAEHAKRGLRPVPPAEKHVLLRRVYIDLIGLPPTRDELHAFLADESPDAYEKVVDRLLDSPHYGERWGRHWMDVWRYSDWAGYGMEIRQSQRHIWRWRDWIVESLNRDKPYDQMIVEMLAGDEVAPTDPDTLRATGFLARSWFKFNRNVWLDNIVEHTSKAFLGLTLNCARCHEHKYDPIEQQEYYQFRAFFEPHDVRTDRLPGQPDVTNDGLPRVFDKELIAPTFLFTRGDDAQPEKGSPLKPDVPRKLRRHEIHIESVSLPTTAYYPGLQLFIQQEMLAADESAVAKARAALDQANRAVGESKHLSANATDEAKAAEADSAVRKGKAASAVVEKQLIAAEAKLCSTRARIDADNAHFSPSCNPNSETLAVEAARLESQAAARGAEEGLLRAEQALADAQSTAQPNDGKGKQAVEAAEKKLGEAREKLKILAAALENKNGKYSPLTEIYPTTSSGRRLALARWIASRENPLTARVAVNHIWMRHFGHPLVPTVFEFGASGKPPTHPELLDWFAVQFMEHGWSMKHLHRLIVSSNTYRMTSAIGDQQSAISNHLAADPDNVYLWRQNARRMEAEIVRDSVLHAAGQLDVTLGGPDIDHNQGMTSRRRSLYFRTAYEKQMTFLALFDQAGVNECYRRSESVVPQQALALANSQLALEQSRLLARCINDLVASDPKTSAEECFVRIAFEQTLTRLPTETEMVECLKFLAAQSDLLADSTKLTTINAGSAATIKPAGDSRLRSRENLVHVLLNHHEFVTIR